MYVEGEGCCGAEGLLQCHELTHISGSSQQSGRVSGEGLGGWEGEQRREESRGAGG